MSHNKILHTYIEKVSIVYIFYRQINLPLYIPGCNKSLYVCTYTSINIMYTFPVCVWYCTKKFCFHIPTPSK